MAWRYVSIRNVMHAKATNMQILNIYQKFEFIGESVVNRRKYKEIFVWVKKLHSVHIISFKTITLKLPVQNTYNLNCIDCWCPHHHVSLFCNPCLGFCNFALSFQCLESAFIFTEDCVLLRLNNMLLITAVINNRWWGRAMAELWLRLTNIMSLVLVGDQWSNHWFTICLLLPFSCTTYLAYFCNNSTDC